MALTTIDIKDLKKIRAYLLQTDRTLKTFVNEAIKEKLEREKGQTKLPL